MNLLHQVKSLPQRHTLPGLSLLLFSLLVPVAPAAALTTASPTASSKQSEPICPQPALSRLTRHRITAGETIATIAQRYNLIPATLMGFNPALQRGQVSVGTEIVIPPYNGIRVEVPSGRSWRDIAKQYNVRADVLFEVNGCQDAPSVVFVPGVNWAPASAASTSAANPLNRYPLPETATILRGYGWQLNPTTSQVVFNSGIDLAAQAETQVIAVGDGTIAFAGEQGNYGKLVVVNHSQGLQTRYAQLANISVRVGQQVRSGDRLGTVGTANSSGRLYFEVRSNSSLGWVAQDPGNYIPALRLGTRAR